MVIYTRYTYGEERLKMPVVDLTQEGVKQKRAQGETALFFRWSVALLDKHVRLLLYLL